MAKQRSNNKGKTATKRVFLALWPDEEARGEICDLQSRFARDKGLRFASIVKRENLHITLHFLGDVNEGDILKLCSLLAHVDQKSFSLTLNQLGYFSKVKILWLGARDTPLELAELVKKTRKPVRKIINNYKQKEFIPHVTLFRKADHLAESGDMPQITLLFNTFVLVESSMHPEGVKYSVLDEWGLI